MALNRLSTCTLLAGLVLASACGDETTPSGGETSSSDTLGTDTNQDDDDDDGNTGSGDDSNSNTTGSTSGTNSGTGTNSGSTGDNSNSTSGSTTSDTNSNSDSSGTTTDPCLFPRLICDGICVDPNSDPLYCGASGDCSSDKGTTCGTDQVCSNGECTAECAQGLIKCGSACIDPLSDNFHCGAKLDCSLPDNAGAECTGDSFCSNGMCVTSCAADQVLCNGSCIDPKSDTNFCGALSPCDTDLNNGEICALGQVCADGVCATECSAGTLKCDGECIDPLTSAKYCGATAPCDAAHNGEACASDTVCSNGSCKAECEPGQVKCDGVCINPLDDANYCGAKAMCLDAVKCNVGDVCIDGMCKPESSCLPPKVQCGSDCIDPKTDSNHCGADASCMNGTICDSTKDLACIGGTCQLSCDSDEAKCAGKCIDPQTDKDYCGAKTLADGGTCGAADDGVKCLATEICSASLCINNCPSDTPLACGGTCVDPDTNGIYCGASAPCDAAHDGETCGLGKECVEGACRLLCPGDEIECGGECIDPKTNKTYCGAKSNCIGSVNDGTTCTGEQKCVGGACDLTCATPGWVECTDLCLDPNDVKSCGLQSDCTGGKTCNMGETCDSGNCVLNCPPSKVKCDGSCIDPLSDELYCGANPTCTDYDWCIGKTCDNGVCKLQCTLPQIACGDSCINPKTSIKYCGATGDCSGSNDGTACDPNLEKCTNGVCVSNGCGNSTGIGTPDPVGVMLILDKSRSMVDVTWNNGGTTETRWASLFKIVDSALTSYAPDGSAPHDVHFGLQLFPKRTARLPLNWAECQTMNYPALDDSIGCDVLASDLTIKAVNTKSVVQGKLPPVDSKSFETVTPYNSCTGTANRALWDTPTEQNRAISGATPTAAAMQNAANGIAVDPIDPGTGKKQSRVAFLVTDGEQTCGEASDTIAQVTALKTAGVPTYVIGIALNTTGRNQINAIATAGGTTAKEANDPTALKTIFDDILKNVISCKITLNPAPAYPEDVHVYFPGPTEVPYRAGKTSCAAVSDAYGWVYTKADKTEIELCNTSCTQFKTVRKVDIVRNCPNQD